MPAHATASSPQAQGLLRPRLLSLLAEPADVTLVVAPAGSGKTTLLAQYLSAAPGATAWFRVSPEDIDPDRLRRRISEVTGRLKHGQRDVAIGDPPARFTATLVIDDFHLLMDTPAEAQADQLLSHLPAGLRVLMASRRVPALNVCRAELGTVTVLTADDLRFRSWEVERLFADVYREPLPPRDAAALTRRTEGWAASLQLFHLSTRGRPLADRRKAITALSGRSRFARSYLTRTVLDELPDQLRDFLRRTCVFEVLTAERCDALLHTTDSQRHLELLERRQALTTSDDGGHSFRYHEVLRRHLESALAEELGAAGTREWYAAAGRVLEQEGALSEALRVYVLAERWPDAARLLRADGARVVDSDARASWTELLPAKLIDEDPWLSIAAGRQLAVEGRLSEAVPRYRHAERLFADPPDREIAMRERRLVELWTGGPAQPHLHWADLLRSALRRQPLGHPVPGGRAPGDVLCWALLRLLAGDVASASDLLDDLTAEPQNGFLGFAIQLAAAAVAGIRSAESPGDTRPGPTERHAAQRLAETVERLAAEAERDGMMWIARQCLALHPLLTDEATAHGRVPLRHLVNECERSGDAWGALLVSGMDALRRLLRAEPAAEAWLALADRCHTLDAGTLEAWALAFGAVTTAIEQAPEGEDVAHQAEATARSVGVPGAEALALLARSSHEPGRSRELVSLARTLAQRHGMPWPKTLEQRMRLPGGDPSRDPGSAPATGPLCGPEPPMTLRCFGGFELRFPHRGLDWRQLRPRAATMLRLLAVHAGQPVHRETIIGALWPDAPLAQATHNLQVAVSMLRRFLEPESPRGEARIVTRHGDAYALTPPPGSRVDVVGFAEALRDARQARTVDAERLALQRALNTYQGDLLPGDGPAEWVVADRERLRVQAGNAAGRLAELEFTRGDIAAAVAAAQRSLEIDPFRDTSWRLLIEAYQMLGDAAAAARARRDYADMLGALGVEDAAPVSRSRGAR